MADFFTMHLRAALVAALVVAPLTTGKAQTAGDIRIEQPWPRATLGTAKTGAGYLQIVNSGAQADRLISATSSAARHVELHEMAMSGNVMQMREVPGGISVPAAGSVSLQPGGLHLMFIDLKEPLRAGTKVRVTLKFERGGEVPVDLDVRDLRTPAAPPSGQSHGHSHGPAATPPAR